MSYKDIEREIARNKRRLAIVNTFYGMLIASLIGFGYFYAIHVILGL